MLKINRDPEGKFMLSEDGVHYWLPVLLDNVSRWRTSQLVTMLRASILWCETKAAREYADAAAALNREIYFTNPQGRAEACAVDASKWFLRKAVLQDAIAKLEAIR